MPKTVRRGRPDENFDPDLARWGNIIGLVLLVLWVGASGVRFIVLGYSKAGDVVEKSVEYEELVEENRRAIDELEYLQTRDGREFAARSDLGYVSKDEQVLEPEIDPEPPYPRGLGKALRRTLHGWEQSAEKHLGSVILQVKCWLGLWTPPGPRSNIDLPRPKSS